MLGESVKGTVVVTNPLGLHVRPCLAIVNTVRQFKAVVKIRNGKQADDATSMLQLMTLAAGQGTELTVSAKGPEAEQALDALTELFAAGFDQEMAE